MQAHALHQPVIPAHISGAGSMAHISNNATPHMAVRTGNLDILQAMLKKGSDIDTPNKHVSVTHIPRSFLGEQQASGTCQVSSEMRRCTSVHTVVSMVGQIQAMFRQAHALQTPQDAYAAF